MTVDSENKWGYYSMKVKTSITLAEDLLKVIDDSRTAQKPLDFFEKAVRRFTGQETNRTPEI
jgi:hypothetical protein